jgi:hypothetical protein
MNNTLVVFDLFITHNIIRVYQKLLYEYFSIIINVVDVCSAILGTNHANIKKDKEANTISRSGLCVNFWHLFRNLYKMAHHLHSVIPLNCVEQQAIDYDKSIICLFALAYLCSLIHFGPVLPQHPVTWSTVMIRLATSRNAN